MLFRIQIDFILSAVREVCTNGWRLLPQYTFNPETGEWKHHTNLVFRERQWLQNISYGNGFFSYRKMDGDESAPDYGDCLAQSREIFSQAMKVGCVSLCMTWIPLHVWLMCYCVACVIGSDPCLVSSGVIQYITGRWLTVRKICINLRVSICGKSLWRLLDMERMCLGCDCGCLLR